MIRPVHQKCPECGAPFMGSDNIGHPCPDCRIIKSIELIERLRDEQKNSRMTNDRLREFKWKVKIINPDGETEIFGHVEAEDVDELIRAFEVEREHCENNYNNLMNVATFAEGYLRSIGHMDAADHIRFLVTGDKRVPITEKTNDEY